jgi:hypothetical protein
MEKIIRYALYRTTGEPAFIKEVANGLACDCVCELCGQALVAAQGKKIKWHFKHAVDSDCPGGQETAIHKLAKKIICAHIEIETPNGRVSYSNPRSEETFQLIRPDIIVVSADKYFFIEILVTHQVDETKELFYTNGKHRSIEIDLQNLPYDISPEDLTEIVIKGTDRKRLIYWDAPENTRTDKPGGPNPILIVALVLGFVYFFKDIFMPKSNKG